MTTSGGGAAGSSAPGPQHAAPSVSTAPARHGARWWSAVPTHLGRARTSTLILAVLFLAIGTLYLNVHPTAATSPGTTTTGGGQPVAPATTSSAPSRTRTTTPAAPSSTPGPTTSSLPTPTQSSTSVPAPTTDSGLPSSSSSAAPPAVPTTSSAPTS